eukprot:TRINITY_DN1400_c0_g1_i3.p1 TRINITY_DN1400_c0_g1~~TRINITY_DN1400_c0_g1_i3.p1  ORF type:complete len:457 (-),score=66.66 TRINITY_DN1400_c0_g1_i3:185-1555(-)
MAEPSEYSEQTSEQDDNSSESDEDTHFGEGLGPTHLYTLQATPAPASLPRIEEKPTQQADDGDQYEHKPAKKMQPFVFEHSPAKGYASMQKESNTRRVMGARGEEVELVTVATQAPEDNPYEEEFDEEEEDVAPAGATEKRAPKIQLGAPTETDQRKGDQYDPSRFWGFDVMFQFPWETVEDLAEARKFRENKKLKNDVEEKEDDENEKLTRRSRLIKTDYSPQVFAARCEAAGLHTSVSSDPEHLYIRVGATWERYEREAERIGFRKRVKEEYLNPMINLRDAENSAVYNEPGISDEDPLRPPERDRVLMVYCPFEPQKRHRFCSSLLAPNSLFSSAERQRLTQSIMEADMNQGGAGINVDADSEVWGYISGAPICLHDWEELNRLERIWHGGKPFGDHPSVFWNLQPFHEIREYYGESVTLYYAWMDLYVTWLGPLSLVGAICWIVYMLSLIHI